MKEKNLAIVSLIFIMMFSVSIISPVLSSPDTSMYVDPATVTADLNTNFTVNIMIADVSQLYTWSFRLSWDPAILSFVGVTEGPFLQDQVSTLFISVIHAEDGYVDVGCTATGTFDGAIGSGVLATVEFAAIGTGSTVLDLQLSLLVKPLEPGKPQETIPHTEGDGFVDVPQTISWRYEFYDEGRGTTLRISTDEGCFQFVAPDKDFGVRYDPNMIVLKHVIIIRYEDSEMRLIATAVDDRIDFCAAIAWDKQTGTIYRLLDKPNWRGSCPEFKL